MKKLYLLGAAGICAGLFGWSALSPSQEKEAPCEVAESLDLVEPISLPLFEVEEIAVSEQPDFLLPEKPDPLSLTMEKDDKGQEKIEATYKLGGNDAYGSDFAAKLQVTVTVDPDGKEQVSGSVGFSRSW